MRKRKARSNWTDDDIAGINAMLERECVMIDEVLRSISGTPAQDAADVVPSAHLAYMSEWLRRFCEYRLAHRLNGDGE